MTKNKIQPLSVTYNSILVLAGIRVFSWVRNISGERKIRNPHSKFGKWKTKHEVLNSRTTKKKNPKPQNTKQPCPQKKQPKKVLKILSQHAMSRLDRIQFLSANADKH